MTDGAGGGLSLSSKYDLPLQSREQETGAGVEVGLGSESDVPPSPICKQLQSLQKKRRFCITSQSRCDRSCEAFIAGSIGYVSPTEKDRDGEKARKAIFADAKAIRLYVEKGGLSAIELKLHFSYAPEAVREIISDCELLILASASARSKWDELRKSTEKQMCELARSLPVYPWAKSVAGFGDKGLAIIIGETGDLSGYPTREKVWKRLGLAVFNGERQRKHTDEVMADIHGYSPKRRAEMWTLGRSMIKGGLQWHGAKDGREAGPSGPYGEVYGRRKAQTADRDWTKVHRNDDAIRIMTKVLIADLWKAWRFGVDR